MKKNILEDVLNFVKFTHKFQQVKRVILATGEDRDENDAEHSFQLALVCWYIAESRQLDLNMDKIIKYALVHDLVEVHAGDTYFYTTNEEHKNSQKDRENKAFQKIKDEFPAFKELHEAIHGYETKADKEARFVYAMDKIMPAMNVFLDNGKSWHRDKVTYDMVRTKDGKVAASADAAKIWTEFLELLEQNKHMLALAK